MCNEGDIIYEVQVASMQEIFVILFLLRKVCFFMDKLQKWTTGHWTVSQLESDLASICQKETIDEMNGKLEKE